MNGPQLSGELFCIEHQTLNHPNRCGLPKPDLNITVFIYNKFTGWFMPRDDEITAAFKDAIKLNAKNRRLVRTNDFRLALKKVQPSLASEGVQPVD
ncbi:hypothetical protein OJE16_10170 [Pantoea tagorei]